MAVYSCLDDIDDDFIQSELSSDRGKTSINDSLLHAEFSYQLARTSEKMHTKRENQI